VDVVLVVFVVVVKLVVVVVVKGHCWHPAQNHSLHAFGQPPSKEEHNFA
jgi:hypothetical protein